MATTGFREFGRFLRNLRLRGGLSLRQVQAITSETPRPDGTSISYGYLYLLERGRPTKVGIAKLITLASVYRVQTRELIDAAPASIRPYLEVEFHRWIKDRPVWVEPPAVVGPTASRVEERFSAVVGSRGRELLAAPDDYAAARDLFCSTVVTSALPVLIASAGRSLTGPFWRACRERVRARLEDVAGASRLWFLIYSRFRDWLAEQSKWIDRLGGLVGFWSGDYRARMLTVRFVDADHDRLYGFERGPVVLIDALRWRHTAALLAACAPRNLSLPPPPDALAGLREYLIRLLGDPAGPPAEAGAVVASIIGLAVQLSQDVPALATTAPSLPPDVQQSIVRLMTRALPAPTD